ncbi:MAG: hypothetical protein Q7U60_10555 [Candidatus Methanoperedens sp.]|nr:hypothetical protein [Candidatus Methanoperedens sp.]
MSGIRINKSGLPITLMKAIATDDRGNELFAVPKILVFISKEIVDIGAIGSRDVKTLNIDSQVHGYIPSVYSKHAPELDLCIGQIKRDCMEIDIVGYLKNGARGQLNGAKIGSSKYFNDENGPHTGWIKVVAKGYKVEPLKDKTK